MRVVIGVVPERADRHAQGYSYTWWVNGVSNCHDTQIRERPHAERVATIGSACMLFSICPSRSHWWAKTETSTEAQGATSRFCNAPPIPSTLKHIRRQRAREWSLEICAGRPHRQRKSAQDPQRAVGEARLQIESETTIAGGPGVPNSESLLHKGSSGGHTAFCPENETRSICSNRTAHWTRDGAPPP
mmetsp:Transcript_20721/g.30529  ORF Transcript_20721/g.30529 Transcript_20721/m.30529 type:complete len:188 (-) Transcript_20721:519-1082(-)